MIRRIRQCLRSGRRITAGALALVGALALCSCTSQVGGTAKPYVDPDPEHQAIIKLVKAFAYARDTADARAMAAAMCRKEGEEFLDQFNDEQLDEVLPDVPEPLVHVTNIEVKGSVARADVAVPDRAGTGGRLYFRQEDDAWKVCTEAESEFE